MLFGSKRGPKGNIPFGKGPFQIPTTTQGHLGLYESHIPYFYSSAGNQMENKMENGQ